MQYIDLKTQQKQIKPSLNRRIESVLAHGQFIMGPEIVEMETALARYCGAEHCISCSSGSSALDLVLMAWGIGQGDAIFTTPLTFIATAESIARTGAVPVLIDISPQTYTIAPEKLELAMQAVLSQDSTIHPLPQAALEQKLHPKGIVPVDLFGESADYDAILAFARKYSLKTLEDGAQSFGGSYKGRALCNCGCDAATTSFFPAKPLGCYGDGGAIFTNDADLAKLLRSLRYHGKAEDDKNNNLHLGTNARMDTLQAAIVLAKLEIFQEEMALRQHVAARYSELLAQLPGVVPPQRTAGCISTWAQYSVLFTSSQVRAAAISHLKSKNIPTAINYPLAVHQQKAFAYLGYSPGSFPVVENITQRILSLPMHPYLDEYSQQYICNSIAEVLS